MSTGEVDAGGVSLPETEARETLLSPAPTTHRDPFQKGSWALGWLPPLRLLQGAEDFVSGSGHICHLITLCA